MNPLSLPFLRRMAPWAPVVIRVLVGVVMTAHGWMKLTDMTPSGFGTGMLAGLDVPAPVFFGWVVTLIELVGGVALIVGLFTRLSALLISLVLLGAVVLVKVDLGLLSTGGAPLPGAELDLALLAGTISLMFMGPGPLSVDGMIGIEEEPAHGALA